MKIITRIVDKNGRNLHSIDVVSIDAVKSTLSWYDLETKESGDILFGDLDYTNKDYYGIYNCEHSTRISCMTLKEYEFLMNLELVHKGRRYTDLDFSNNEVPVWDRGLVSNYFNKFYFIDESGGRFPNLISYMITLLKCPDYQNRYWKIRGETVSIMTIDTTYIFRIRNMAKFTKSLIMG